MTTPIDVLVSCYNRPLYLWTCLDSLCRNTRYPHRFTVIDMASEDPLVGRVIAGFERRGMFSQALRAPRNDPDELWKTIWRLVAGSGEYFGYVDGDVVVEESDPCWLTAFVNLMQQHPRLAMVGSAIDKRDFVTWECARALEPTIEEERLAALIKLRSPERTQDLTRAGTQELAFPHHPPGRLILLRCAALTRVGAGTDFHIDRRFREAGYETGIATAVRHRHLSLLNLFDYAEYGTASRDAFFGSADRLGPTTTR